MPSGPSPPTAPQEETGPVPSPSQPTRRLIRLSSPERQRLSSLHLTPDPEMEPPPKPPRSCSALARQALEGSFVGWGVPVQSPQVLAAMGNEEEESPSSSEEEAEEEEDVPLDSDVEQVLWNLVKNSGPMNNYPTWRRTLLRRAREEQMKRFCKAQTIQRRLNEIEADLRELEAKGTELELSLRSQSSSPEQQKALWLEQLLQLVQKKNTLVAEEADLMITVQELTLEEKQWQLDQELRTYMNREGRWDVGEVEAGIGPSLVISDTAQATGLQFKHLLNCRKPEDGAPRPYSAPSVQSELCSWAFAQDFLYKWFCY